MNCFSGEKSSFRNLDLQFSKTYLNDITKNVFKVAFGDPFSYIRYMHKL